MLILSRKVGQKIIINDNIELTILDTGASSIKIGIHAPAGVKIYREEVYNAVKQANVESNLTTKSSLDNLNKITDSKNSIVENIKAHDE